MLNYVFDIEDKAVLLKTFEIYNEDKESKLQFELHEGDADFFRVVIQNYNSTALFELGIIMGRLLSEEEHSKQSSNDNLHERTDHTESKADRVVESDQTVTSGI